MNDADTPTLEVGFAIETGASFEALRQLQAAMDTTEGKIVAEAARIEKATGGMINLAGAKAQITAFGGDVTREMASIARETAKAEKAAEAMVRQLEREAQAFGKSRSELRQMRAELRAVEAENRGLTEVAGRLRTASAEIDRLENSVDRVGRASGRSHGTMMQFGMQINDVATMAALGAPPMQIFASQAGQILQVAQQAEGGVKGFATQVGALVVRFAPWAVGIGVAVGAFALFDRAVSKGIDTKAMVDGLGLTRAEIKKLENVSVSTSDVVKATFQVMAERVGISLTGMSKWFSDAMDWMTTAGRNSLAALYASFVGTFRGIGAIVQGVFAGKGVGEILADVGDAYTGTFKEANAAMTKFGEDVNKQIGSNKLADLRKQAAALKADRAPDKAKVDRHAAQLEREARATEAQINNLFALADAYGVSGAEALIAEARVKAETQAIKQRGDITAAVERQIRLAVAQRVSDAAKGTASMREQAALQEKANIAVAQGNVLASQAADYLRDLMAELPLIAALEAARAIKNVQAIEAATKALDEQRAARGSLNDEEAKGRLNLALEAGKDRLAELREEQRLIGATDEARARVLATIKAEQQARAEGWGGKDAADYVRVQADIAAQTVINTQAQNAYNDALSFSADRWELIARNVDNAARGMADAFGEAGRAIGDMAAIFAGFHADQTRMQQQHDEQIRRVGKNEAAIAKENAKFALATSTMQVGLYGDMTAAAKGFFKEGSSGYKALETAEKTFRAVEFALSVRAMAQDAVETASSIAKSGARTAVAATEAVVNAIKSLPFPLNLAAGAATVAALASIGIAVGGAFAGSNKRPTSNTGTGTVFGDSDAKSESIKRAIDSLKEVDVLMLSTSRGMAASLRSIDSQIGGFAALVVRAGDVNASGGVDTGFKANAIGSVLGSIPLVGGILKSLFGTKTTVVGSGLFGGPQALADILGGGFDADYYSDVQKKKKFLGLTTSTKYSTQYSDADPGLENQFTLILRSFNDAITAAAGPLGAATQDIQSRLNGFVLNIGKIDLQGLTGEEIQEKLSAVFGAAADKMALAAFPGMERFQQVGEGAFETLVRVASTVEAVTATFDQLGFGARALGIDAKMAVAAQFDSVSDMTSAVQSYFEDFYTKEEQAAARTAQFAKVFGSLNLAMPSTLASFRALVDAQDLTTAAGQSTYATLLQLAPAFADLKTSMDGAKSAADILTERQDLERRILELRGDTGALRALELAKLDASNRALQEQIYAIEDAQEAARAADELRQAWTSVGDSIMDEVRRIRGLTGAGQDGSFASLMGQFNAANTAARGGDQDAAKSLPGLSQALLRAAELAAASRQELERVQGQTAATLEATYAAIQAMTGTSPASDASTLAAAATAAQAAPTNAAANDDLVAEVKALRTEVVGLRADANAGLAATAGNTGAIKKHLDNVTGDSGGNAISTVAAA